MKKLFWITIFCFGLANTTLADDRLSNKWYAGEWLAKIENIDGRDVWYGLHIQKGNEVRGCIYYPNKDGESRRIYGEILSRRNNRIKIKLSHGKDIEIRKQGIEPNHNVRLYYNRNRNQHLMKREFLPKICL